MAQKDNAHTDSNLHRLVTATNHAVFCNNVTADQRASLC